MTEYQPGRVILLGSGETSPHIRKTYDWLFQQLETPVSVSILETPAGFEPNSEDVAGQVGEYLEKHLQNYRPQVSVIPARKRGTDFSPDDPNLLTPFYASDILFMGPGSPTYAVRQLQDSVAWHTMQACHRLGADLIFASAASLACSLYTMPIYEIYKVGEDLHWKPGLDFFGAYGLPLLFVPHWNNNDGGAALDTSRCYIGQDRFHQLLTLMDEIERGGYTVVGLDENTALIVDPQTRSCQAMGQGGVTILRDGKEAHFAAGDSFAISHLGAFQIPAISDKIPTDICLHAETQMQMTRSQKEARPEPPAAALSLLEERIHARQAKDWAKSDSLRDEIAALGWAVQDTRDGSHLEPIAG